MYAILDIESTGGKFNEEGIMEIAIHRFDGHQVVDKFISLVNPEREIQPFVSNLTGINNKMLHSAPKFHEVAKRIVEITQNAILVAHNAQFDYRILRTEFRRLGYDFKRKSLCTVDLSQKLIPEAESYSLGKLVRSLGIPVSDRHRANGDALATLKLFKVLLAKDTGKSILQTIVRSASQGELSPRQLDIVEGLPTETGVYFMHAKDGKIIFIGKSKNIKKRVNQHFTNTGKLARTLQKETKSVRFEKTGDELIALLKEYHEVTQNKPKYNKINLYQGFSHGLYASSTKEDGLVELVAERANGQLRRVGSFTNLKAVKKFSEKLSSEFEFNNGNKVNTSTLIKIQNKYSIEGRTILLLGKGRELGEKSVVYIKNGGVQGYGFSDLNHQINNITILKSIITPIQGDKNTTLLVESYLRTKHKMKIVALNQNY
jgi:DNA polymerase-3 subunit epsilon